MAVLFSGSGGSWSWLARFFANQTEELVQIVEDLKADNLQAAAPLPSQLNSVVPQLPPLPGPPEVPEVEDKPELADRLSPFAKQLQKPDDSDTADAWLKQAERTVRQFCRLTVIGKTEAGIAEDIRSFQIFES